MSIAVFPLLLLQCFASTRACIKETFVSLLPDSSTNNKVKEEVARLFYFKLYYVSMVVMFFIPQIVMQVIVVWFPRPSRQ
jgi:hypothetical protein